MKKILFLILCYGLPLVMLGNGGGRDTITVTKIWDQEKHNGFPDLYYFNHAFYCTFREGPNHVDSLNRGRLRIIKSADGKKWETVALFEMPGMDVREARLSTTPAGNMMAIVAIGIWKTGGYVTLAPYVSYSDKKGNHFSAPEKVQLDAAIVPSVDWIWRVTWHRGVGYGVIYQVKGGQKSTAWEAHVLRTYDGKRYEKISQLPIDGNPNESTIRFDEKGKMYILVRREAGDKMGVLAKSDFPYNQWSLEKLGLRLGGPNFVFLNKNQLCIGSRLHDSTDQYATKKNVTAIFVSDLHGKILKTVSLPSGGDTGYPGMVMLGKNLWVAYYSSHEGKASIYFAKIPLAGLKVE